MVEVILLSKSGYSSERVIIRIQNSGEGVGCFCSETIQ